MLKKLDLRIVDEKFHQFQYHPQQYLIRQLKQQKQWQEISPNTIQQFFSELNHLYKDEEDGVTYHNLTHGFDVSTTLDCYLTGFMIEHLSLSSFERICMLIAAYAHDNGHQGYNNHFYIDNHLELALKYSYISPLENMHASNLMRLIVKYELPIPLQQRKMMVSMILGTDMAHHMEVIDSLSQHMDRYQHQLQTKKDRQFLMNTLIHAADLNNSTKPTNQHIIWTEKVALQFANQRKKQSQIGTVSVIKGKKKPGQSEYNFLNKVIFPFYEQLSILNPEMKVCLVGIEKNMVYWKSLTEQSSE